MNNLPSLQYSTIDYETIEAAVIETERGRWFLAEYQRRNRHADTAQVLGAIEKMQVSLAETVSEHISNSISEHSGGEKPADPAIAVLRQDLIEMAMRIADTHTEVAALGSQDHDPKHVDLVSGELDAIVRSTEQATSEILESAEQIQEIAWTLREGGLAVETCDAIDVRATNIYLACSFQDLTAQRATKVIETMRFLENRINKMIGILQGVEGFRILDLAPDIAESPSLAAIDEADRSLQQNDVDFALQWESEQGNETTAPFIDAFATFAQGSSSKTVIEGFLDDSDDMFSDEGVIAAPPPEADAYLSEAEIADSLDALPISPPVSPPASSPTASPASLPAEEPEVAAAPMARIVHLADVHAETPSMAGTGDGDELITRDPRSMLEALDEADLNRKLSLFT